MLFQWTEQAGSKATVVHDCYIAFGGKTKGLRHNFRRPDEVVLTRHELWQLFQDRDYADHVVRCLAEGKRAAKSKSGFKPMTDQEYLDDKGA